MTHPIHRLFRSATLAFQRASAPPPSRPMRSGGTGPKLMLTLAAGLLLSAMSAQATHFRGASLTWKRLASPANTIEATITESWRTGGLGSNSYNWGDNTFVSTSGATVIATNADFTVIRRVMNHTYSSEGPWTISTSGCCRISNLTNAADRSWFLSSVVDMRSGNQGSPVITSPVILQMISGGINTVPLAFVDVDGDPVTFRMATAAESGIPTVAQAGGKILAVSPAGVLTWDTSSTVVGQFYAAQVIAGDNHVLSPSGAGATRVQFDFVIQIVDGTLNRPPVASGNGGPFIASIGQPFANVIIGTDTDGGNLTVTHQGLPPGATLTPASGTTGAQPLTATFNWTPTLAQADSSYGITIVYTDPGGLQASKSFAITVPSNQPPVAYAGPDQTVFDTNTSGVRTTVPLSAAGSYDPENVPLTYSWTLVPGTTPVTLLNANTATPSFLAPSLHVHPDGEPEPINLIFRLDVSDGKTVRSDDVLIVVKHQNLVPVAVATGPAMALEAALVTLDGSASSDPDLDPLSFTWAQTTGTLVTLAPNGTNNPTISFSHVVNAPHSVPGELLEFTLTVSDGIDGSTSSVVPVFIKNVNQAPVADAGHAHPVFDNEGTTMLDGYGYDVDGDAVTLLWTQIAGPAAAFDDPTLDEPTITVPAVSAAQGSVTLTFKLTVSDANSANDPDALSSESTVDLLVKHANRAPIADAGLDKNVPEQTLVTLDGSGSYDPDNDAITYAWSQTGGQPVALDATDPVHPTFTAPDVNAAGATLTFELIVTDVPGAGSGASLSSAPKTVTFSVKYVNRPPVAIADAVLAHDEGTVVSLGGTHSYDPDGNAFSYLWSQVSGPAVIGLSDATAAEPTFTAPAVDRFGGTVVFELKTTDEFGGVSAPATTSFVVRNVNHAPVADAGVTQSVPEDTLVNLSGLANDQDTEEQSLLTYAWQQIGGPGVALTGDTTLSPTFQAPIVTGGGDPLAKVTLKFKVTATDPNGASGSDEMEVVVANVDHAPVANAGGVILTQEAVVVALDGSLSSDPDGDALTYAWVQIAGPAVTLADASTAAPSFTTPFVNAAGTTLKFQLTVNDGFGASSSDVATVTVANRNDPPAVTSAQPSTGALWPPNHSMVKISVLGIADPNNNAVITVTRVTQDEATNGLGDGDTAIDAIINADGTVLVRAERSGKGNGRVYHIHFTASDFEGSASGVVKVTVPHDKKSTAIDGGELFDSTH